MRVVCLQNVSASPQSVGLESASIDLITGVHMPAAFTLSAYQTCWLVNGD
jgi:hypothetical protein